MHGSSHIQSVLIVVEYQNCYRNLDVYLRLAIWIGQIQSKLLNELLTNQRVLNFLVLSELMDWMVCNLHVGKFILIELALSK